MPDGSHWLKDLATQFFLDIAPRGVKELDQLFELWKTDLPKKQENNFGIALPPAMRERVLAEIGFANEKPANADRYLRYLNLFNRLLDRKIEDLLEMTTDELTTQIWQEGRRLSLRETEMQELATFLPHWIQKIGTKVVFEFSPLNICEMAKGKAAPPEVSSTARFKNIIGKSEQMQSIFGCIERISKSTLSVLIQGESGTGKDLVAHAIHLNSPRAGGPFIPVNCGALPESIIESELFGHERGAFTGAVATKNGYFEIANGGTLFLDEISETSLNIQVKLLRAIQERKICRVGGTRAIDVDIRIITATNRDLLKVVRDGQFRHDLYYRINEMTITLPPLRDRQGDLPLLIDHFLARFATENEKPMPKVDAAARRLLFSYGWPGNIRELENVLKRAVVLADRVILPAHLPTAVLDRTWPGAVPAGSGAAPASGGSLEDQLQSAERQILERALANNQHNVSLTAKVLKISRRTLQRKMKALGLLRPEHIDQDE